ncbi:MAG: amidohydrolase family protein [Actinomycetes bacterium]
MDPARSLIDAGVHTSLHSEAWVTPIDQLKSIVCATTRQTYSGFVLGADQIITVQQALKAVTLDAADANPLATVLGGKILPI